MSVYAKPKNPENLEIINSGVERELIGFSVPIENQEFQESISVSSSRPISSVYTENKKDKEKYKLKKNALKEKIKENMENEKKMMEEIFHLKSTNDGLNNKIAQLKAINHKLSDELDHLKAIDDGLKDKIYHIEVANNNLSEKNDQLKNLNIDLNGKFATLMEIQQKQSNEIEAIERDRIKSLNAIGINYADQQKNQIQILEEKNKEYLTKQEELIVELQQCKSQLYIAEEKLKHEITTIESEISIISEENDSSKRSHNFEIYIKPPTDELINSEYLGEESKISDVSQYDRETMNAKDYNENKLQGYESYQRAPLKDNELNYLKELEKKLEFHEKLIESLNEQLKLKEKESEENAISYELLNKESISLRNQIKLFTKSDQVIEKLQEQLISNEKNFNLQSLELKAVKLEHSKQIKELLDQLEVIKSTIQDSDKYYVNQINKLVAEKDHAQRKLDELPFVSRRESIVEFAQSTQEESISQALRNKIHELNDLRADMNLLQEKTNEQEKKITKYRLQINTLNEEKINITKNFKKSQKQLRSLSKELND